ncbi:MAG: hydantoinase/oxoprolinase family protein [Gammaproteobacteria bacterium]|nr:hydantoinase/oxoprolinase family protein [Gammaproteobacteria bacterium]
MMRLAIDVGGTFTDVVAVDEAGTVTFVKVPSTPHDQSLGVMDGIALVAGRLSVPVATLLSRTERIVHGMTVATNALIERKGARVGLLTTAGHRDILEMREGLKPERYNLRLPRAAPLVPRHLRLGVRERLRADGRVEIPLDEASLAAAIGELERAGVQAVAVGYLHAYRDDRHERATRARLAEAMPQAYVSLSSEVLPQIKEYQRLSTTVVNAYVGPAIRYYLRGLESRLAAAGYSGALLIMLSHGGVGPVDEAIRVAAATVLSGPAGGLAGARHVGAALLEAPDLIGLDMGGTSTDISLVVGGQAQFSPERIIAHQSIALPSLDIITLGAGGGSIGHTKGGLLQVGPASAGAQPGPACYGLGAEHATVTDASVVLGYLDPDRFLGGTARLDAAAAERALRALGAELGLDAVRTAEGMHRVVNAHMAEGIRLATVRRGIDPRRFGLVGFGGAAGLHATDLARALRIRRVIIPRYASVLCAWGMHATELRFATSRSHVGATGRLEPALLRQTYAQLEARGTARMRAWFDGSIECRRSADMRYGEQIHEIDVSLDGIDLDDTEHSKSALKAAFEARHRALYTYALDDQDPILINARVTIAGLLAPLPAEQLAATMDPATPSGTRSIYLGSWLEADVYAFDSMAPGQNITGPAIIESDTTTVLLRRSDRASLTVQGCLDIAVV